MAKYFLMSNKGSNGYTIVKKCISASCEVLHYFTSVDDEFSGKVIVKALNNE